MPDTHDPTTQPPHASTDSADRVRDDGAGAHEIAYPENHVVGVVAPSALPAALEALAAGGFMETELEVRCGSAYAARLDASTGRTGLLDRILRVAERIGVRNDELKLKDRYEAAIREGDLLVLVLAPTDERRDRAGALLHAHGARLVHHFGRFTITTL